MLPWTSCTEYLMSPAPNRSICMFAFRIYWPELRPHSKFVRNINHVEAFCCILLFRIWKRTEQRSLGSNEKRACPPLLYTCTNVANSPAHCVWAATKPCRLASSNNTVHTRIFSWSSYCIFWQTVAAETFTLFSYYAHFFWIRIIINYVAKVCIN